MTEQDLGTTVEAIIGRFDDTSAVRDTAISRGRQLIRLSANAIRALHRGDDAESLLRDARALMTEVASDTRPYPAIYWAGYVQDAMKEYAEAQITAALIRRDRIPGPESLRVEDAAWLNGLAEAASELRRDVLDALRQDDLVRAEHLLDAMDAVYGVLVTVDFPDAVTGGLRRTTDQFRGVLERTRADLTLSLRQSRLEHALREAENRMHG